MTGISDKDNSNVPIDNTTFLNENSLLQQDTKPSNYKQLCLNSIMSESEMNDLSREDLTLSERKNNCENSKNIHQSPKV